MHINANHIWLNFFPLFVKNDTFHEIGYYLIVQMRSCRQYFPIMCQFVAIECLPFGERIAG